jgi:uncharacterized protein YecT (DUF1311 family)
LYRWIKSSIFATAAVLFVVGPALADERANDPWCKKATLPSSIAICSDPELWALATERNRLFAELQRRLKPAAWRALQADQREWVHRYAGECGIEPDVAPDLPLAPQIKDCMLRAGQARIEYLRNYALPTPQPTTDATSQPKFPSPGSTSAKPPSPAPTSQNETPATSSASPTTPPGAQGPLQAERPPYLIAAILGTIVITGIGCAFYTRKESGGGRATSVVKTLPTVSTPSPPSDRPIIEPSPERRDQSAERLLTLTALLLIGVRFVKWLKTSIDS